MHSIDLILTLTGAFGVAVICGYATNRIGLSPIVGYLFAGLLVGPYTPGYVADQHLAEQLAEVGVILLMFGVGLQFHFEELLAVRKIAIPGALVQSTVATVLGAAVAHWFGWPWSSGLVFGIALSVASTVVLVRVLADNRDLHTPTGHIAVGWLVVEDLLTVVVLVLMPALAHSSGSGRDIALTLVAAILKIGALVAFTIIAGGRIIPWVLRHIAITKSRELFTLTVLALALGIAVASALLFGASMALGAFLAGMVVGRSEFSVRAASDALPMRDAFAVLFFVSVGMLLEPQHLLREPGFILLTLAVVMIGKPLAALAITVLFRQPLTVSASIAVVLSQIGEFSFIVATLGMSLGLLTREAMQTLVAAAIVSITLNPILYRAAKLLSERVETRRKSVAPVDRPAPDSLTRELEHKSIVVGYGPVGRTVARLLKENDIEVSVLEMNLETAERLRAGGINAVYGDAESVDALAAAGVADARSLIVSVAGMPGIKETIRIAKELNPRIRVLVRTAHLREAAAIRAAGADQVFSGEAEVALAFTAEILERLGATPEQIERERARVHAELR
ncbi:MAG: cation:proton antiporter [Acidobacteria bacterium]|nr:cation:proton antiporter [Acidobacteriota bacterium]